MVLLVLCVLGRTTPSFADAPDADRAAKCLEAAGLIRESKFSEAVSLLSPLVRNSAGGELEYLHGYAAFAAGDYGAAFGSLSTLAPFEQPGIGVHARYLIARMHHLAKERPEAAANYQAVVAEFDRQRKANLGRLADPKLSEEERQRMSTAARAPAPDYVARALFYWGVILSEFGAADEAASKFAYAVQLRPDTPVAAEARLRGGACAVQAKKHGDAIALLTPIADHPELGDQALSWLAKAQYGVGATPVPMGRGAAALVNAQPDPRRLAQGIKDAVATLKKAEAGVAAACAARPEDAAAKQRRGAVLLGLGDFQILDRAYADAAGSYAGAAKAGAAAEVAQAALLRRAIALQLAGDLAASDRACTEFVKAYPGSPEAAEALVRYAENAVLATSYGEGSARLNRVIEKYPDARAAQVARFGLAAVQYLQGRYPEAAGLLAKIPAEERAGDLLPASLMLADCQLRALPSETPDDALSSARLVRQMEEILAPLDAYVQSKPNDPDAADAYLRIGYAANRLQGLLAEPLEKRRTLSRARRAYMAIAQQFPDHPLYPVALLENAKMIAAYAGAAPAVMELSKFRVEPLSQSRIAPLALIHLADAMRLRRKPDEALAILSELKQRYEAALLKDSSRAGWVAAMRYEEGLALKEAGKYDPAREAFESLAKAFPDRPEAKEAVLRVAQCRLDPVMGEVEGLRRALASAGRAQMQSELLAKLVESAQSLRLAAGEVDKVASALAARDAESPVLPKLRHDEASAWRIVGEVEVEAQRRRLREDAAKKILAADEAERAAAPEKAAPQEKNPPQGKRRDGGRKVRTLEMALSSVPMVPISAIPLQPGEKVAREKLRAVVESGEDSPPASEARVELAELYASRGELGPAIELLKQAVGAETQPDLVERLRIRLAALYLDNGDAASAQSAAEPLVDVGRNAYAVYARVVLVEALYRLGKWDAVIEQAGAFAGAQRLEKLTGVSDHALLRLAQAQQKLEKWPESRATLEGLVGRFGKSTALLREAQSSLALAYEKLNENEMAAALRRELAKVGADAAKGGVATNSPNPDWLAPRIPNLLAIPSRKGGGSGSNAPGQPAPAIVTPPVNNLEGTEALAPLKFAARGVEVDVVPIPQALAFDAEPYVKSPAAQDDRDLPGQ
jgi:TolA-binding protein